MTTATILVAQQEIIVDMVGPGAMLAARHSAIALEAARDAEDVRAEVASTFSKVEAALEAITGVGSVVGRGLIHRFDGTLAGWTGGTDNWGVANTPALVGFDRSPIPAQVPGTGSDAGGVREGQIFDDDDGTRYLLYGAGDGSQGAGGQWRVHLSQLVNGDWVKLGPLNMGLSKGDVAGNYAATDMLYLEKRAGEILLHRMYAGGAALNQIPSQPYQSDMWKASHIKGEFTFVRKILEAGPAGSFDAVDAYTGSVVFDGVGTYHNFYSAVAAGGKYQIGRATSNSPLGPFAKTGVPVLPASFITGGPENPKVSWHSGLDRWVMLTNQIAGDFTAYNRLFFSRSLTDWSKATYCDFTPISPMAGAVAIGLASGFYGPSNVPELDFISNPAGSYPVTYDTDPTGPNPNHINRKLYYMTLEASTSGLLTAANAFHDDFTVAAPGDLGGQNGWTDDSRVGPKPQIIAGAKLDMGSAPGTATGSPLVLRPSIGNSVMQRTMIELGATNVGVSQIFAYLPTPNLGRFIQVVFGGSSVDLFASEGANSVLLATSAPGIGAGPKYCEAFYNPDEGRFSVYVDYELRFTFVLSALHRGWMDEGGMTGLRSAHGGTGARLVYSHSVSSPLLASSAPIYKPVVHSGFVLETAIRPFQPDAFFDLFYHLRDTNSTANGYRAHFDKSGANPVCTGIYKRVNGVETELAGATATRVQKASRNLYTTPRLSVQANVHTVEINGEKQFEVIDATFTSGKAIAFSGRGEMDIRQLSMRKSNEVTVNGVAAGQKVTLRGAGRIPLANVIATGPSVTLLAKHFPATSIDVDDDQRYAVAGGIWGGDEFV